MTRRIALWVVGICLLAGVLLLGLVVGSVQTFPVEALSVLFDPSRDPVMGTILWEIRLPRVLRAAFVGGMLSLAGAVFQVLLRNPLADPYVLGVSGGASVGAIAVLLAGAGSGLSMTSGAFGGALLTVVIVFFLAGGWRGTETNRLLLTGVVLASFWGALVTLFLSMSQDERLRSVLFWLMGDLGQRSALSPLVAVVVLGLVSSLFLGRGMDALLFGDRHAAGLGVAVRPVRISLYLMGSLLTAAAVSAAGSIGFVGLVVPHAIRLLGITAHRELLPASALAGAGFLVLADTAARTIVAPIEIPAGVVTAFVGAPFFLWLLVRERGR